MQRRAIELKARYWRELADERPHSIDEKSWGVFLDYVRDGRTIRDIGRGSELRSSEVEAILASIEHALSRPPDGSIPELTHDSPLEALGLSTRTRNKLHQLGCHSVGALTAKNFAHWRLSPVAARELASTLRRHGLPTPIRAAAPGEYRIGMLARALADMRERMELDHQRWRNRLHRLELRMRKLSG